jgi:hypothetical protein
MPQAAFVAHGHEQVLIIDLAGVSDYGVLPRIVENAMTLARSGSIPGSLRTLVDPSGTRINRDVVSALKELSRHNGRYAMATAFVGLSWGWGMVLTALLRVRGKRNHKVIAGRSEAMEWLGNW